jgi:hypothetical protein
VTHDWTYGRNDTVYQAIEAMLVLHDICIDWNDHPDTIWQYNSTDIWEGWDGVEDRVDDEDEEREVGIDDIEGEANMRLHSIWRMKEGENSRLYLMNYSLYEHN